MKPDGKVDDSFKGPSHCAIVTESLIKHHRLWCLSITSKSTQTHLICQVCSQTTTEEKISIIEAMIRVHR